MSGKTIKLNINIWVFFKLRFYVSTGIIGKMSIRDFTWRVWLSESKSNLADVCGCYGHSVQATCKGLLIPRWNWEFLTPKQRYHSCYLFSYAWWQNHERGSFWNRDRAVRNLHPSLKRPYPGHVNLKGAQCLQDWVLVALQKRLLWNEFGWKYILKVFWVFSLQNKVRCFCTTKLLTSQDGGPYSASFITTGNFFYLFFYL